MTILDQIQLDDDEDGHIRNYVIAMPNPTYYEVGSLHENIRILLDLLLEPNHRGELTELCLSLSLCPIHRVDWAICFDDEDPECVQVRTIYPNSHDT